MSTSISDSTAQTTYNVCQTAGCAETAKSFLEFMDFNADPCSDFYQYTCGSWLQSATLPPDKKTMGPFYDVNDVIADVLHDILEGEYEDVYQNLKDGDTGFHTADEQEADKANFQGMKDYYNLCMDTATLNELGPTPIYPELAKIQNSIFPVIQNETYSSKQVNQLTNILIYLSRIGIQTIAAPSVSQMFTNSQENAIFVDLPTLTLQTAQAYEKPEMLEKFTELLIKTVTSILGESACESCDEASKNVGLQLWSTEKIQSAVSNFIGMEITIANITNANAQVANAGLETKPSSLTDFQNAHALIDWKSYLQGLVLPGTALPETILNFQPTYYDDLNQLLASNINMVALQDYFTIAYIMAFSTSLHTEPYSAVSRIKAGPSTSVDTTEEERWKTCVEFTNGVFESLLGRYYILRAFGGEAERNMTEVFVSAIQNSWRETIPATTWLDDQTRAKAMEKLNLIKHKSAYPTVSPDVRSPVSISQYYDGLKPNQTSFFDSQMKQLTWKTTLGWKQLGRPVDRDAWKYPPQMANAFYNPSNNEIIVPVGILQPLFYSNSYPDFVNYGSLGYIVGHEISHGFDDQGRLFDGQGNRVDWWTDATTKEFETRSQCFVDQYSKFNVSGPDGPLQVDGQLTLGENIADNGGIAASFRAYQSLRPNGAEPESRLPGLEEFTPEQLFFLSFGRTWCSMKTEQYTAFKLLTDNHSPDGVRINAVAQNSVEFSKAFNCPVGSPMNPENKCKIW